MRAMTIITPDMPAASVLAYVQAARAHSDAVTVVCAEGVPVPVLDGVRVVAVTADNPLTALEAILARSPQARLVWMSQAAYNHTHTRFPAGWAHLPRTEAVLGMDEHSLHILQRVAGGVRDVTATLPALVALLPAALPPVPLNPFAATATPDEKWPIEAHTPRPQRRRTMLTQLDAHALTPLRDAVHAALTPPAHGLTTGEVTPGPATLTTAPVIVGGGKGLAFNHPTAPQKPFAERVQDGFAALVEPLAAVLGGTAAASRAVIDAAGMNAAWQVGQSGLAVSPDVYIAIGIGGAAQHMQGVAHSKLIIAVNADAEAPIFQQADYGIVGNAYTVVPQLIAAFTG